jgi:hypothetical protein
VAKKHLHAGEINLERAFVFLSHRERGAVCFAPNVLVFAQILFQSASKTAKISKQLTRTQIAEVLLWSC